jgi:ligand-binding SRPBCC domain-containing protein
MYLLARDQSLPAGIDEVFAFFSDARNLEAITPRWLDFRILTAAPIRMAPGAEIEYELRWRVFPIRWKTVITRWEPPRLFTDEQVKGPYRVWRHTHSFEPDPGGTVMRDEVRYELPLGILGRAAHAIRVRRDLERIFDHRAAEIGRVFATGRYPMRNGGLE